MARSSPGGGILLVWTGSILIDLFVVLVLAHDAEKGALLFGRTGTDVLLLVLAVLAVVSAACAWRGVTGAARGLLATAQFVAAVVVLVMLFGFFGGDGTTASSLTPLLIYGAFAEVMIGLSVLRAGRRGASTRGR